MEVISKWTSGGTALNLLLRNKEELVRDQKTDGSLSSCSHEPVEFKIWRQARKTKNRIKIVNFKTACSAVCLAVFQVIET